MIAKLTGIISDIAAKSAIIDVNGVGYRVALLGAQLATLKLGEQATLLIYHQITDGAENLYGFATEQDQHYFELLLTVPSVGPRTAMNILDIAPPKTLAQAVADNDKKLLTKVSGVGSKTAERILIELKGKIKPDDSRSISGDIQSEAVSVLAGIGFSREQARRVMQTLPPEIKTVAEAVKAALQEKS